MKLHRYTIDRFTSYPLSQAAKAAEMPQGKLRRAIVLGELEAEPVADERDYLVEGRHLQEYIRSLRTNERAEFSSENDLGWVIGLFLAIPLLTLMIAIPLTDATKEKPQGPTATVEDAPPTPPRPPPRIDEFRTWGW